MDKDLTEIVHEGRVTRRRLLFGTAGRDRRGGVPRRVRRRR